MEMLVVILRFAVLSVMHVTMFRIVFAHTCCISFTFKSPSDIPKASKSTQPKLKSLILQPTQTSPLSRNSTLCSYFKKKVFWIE